MGVVSTKEDIQRKVSIVIVFILTSATISVVGFVFVAQFSDSSTTAAAVLTMQLE